MTNRDTSLGFEAQSDHRFSDPSYSTGSISNHINTATSRRGKKKDYGQSGNTLSLVNQALSTPHSSTAASTNDTDSESQTWQCTFCYQHIARKSWRRHEETQHRPKRKWTCLLTGPSLTIPSQSDTSTFCVLCMIPNPSDNHFAECHRIAECMAKNEDERTFLRPDHLRQHVKNFHKAKLDETIRDIWRREGPGSDAVGNWVCGFCAKVLKTWDDRETHIAGHFNDGLTMADWNGNARPHAEVEASKKRPISSEGRPNMLTKLARTLTGRSTRDQHACEAHEQVADTIGATSASIHAPDMDTPQLPELVFEDFMPGLGDAYYSFDETSLVGVYEQDFASAERHDSAFPDGDNTTLDFGSLTEEFVDHNFSNGDSFGLW